MASSAFVIVRILPQQFGIPTEVREGHMQATDNSKPTQRVLRYKDVASETGLKKTLFYNELKEGFFPSGFKIGRTRAWYEDQIIVWQDLVRFEARAATWLQNVVRTAGRITQRHAQFLAIFEEGRVARDELIQLRRYLETCLKRGDPHEDVKHLLESLDELLPELYWLRQSRGQRVGSR